MTKPTYKDSPVPDELDQEDFQDIDFTTQFEIMDAYYEALDQDD